MRLLWNALRRLFGLFYLAMVLPLGAARRWRLRHRPLFLTLELDGPLPDLPQPTPFWLRFVSPSRGLNLLALCQALEAAQQDPEVAGVYLRLRHLEAGWANIWELRQALDRFRQSGKKVIVYFHQAHNRAYYLASVADSLFCAPEGVIELLGLRTEVTFLRSLFDQLGVTPDFLKVGRYKSFAETYTESRMSDAMQESLTAVMNDLHTLFVQGIAQGRELAEAEVQRLIDAGPYSARGAMEAELVDNLLYPDEVREQLTVEGHRPRMRPLARYARAQARRRRLQAPVLPQPLLAVVSLEGAIQERSRGLGAATSPAIDARRSVLLLEALRKDDQVAGVVLRVNSPGGSALASDLIWRGVQRLQEKKPVYVSMGELAASGGYYLSAPAGRILATPATLTGSIGVVAGKFSLGLLLDRLGIQRTSLERGKHAGIYSTDRPFSESEREALQTMIEHSYQGFLRRVREGRHLEEEAASAAAEGRVWSGQAGLGHRLVDGLGGLWETIQQLKETLAAPRGLEVVVLGPRAGFSLSPRFFQQSLPPALAGLWRTLERHQVWLEASSPVFYIMPAEVEIR